jgi:glycosyltransferase involved in cell wall biosynthesis
VLLSINRFERKKGLALALRCLAELRRDASASAPLHLVQAGGFDPRLAENVEHLQELRDEAQALGVADAVTFVPSFSDEQKVALLAAATVVLYTPQVRLRCRVARALPLTRRAARALWPRPAGGNGGAARGHRVQQRRPHREHRGRRDRLSVRAHAGVLCFCGASTA